MISLVESVLRQSWAATPMESVHQPREILATSPYGFGGLLTSCEEGAESQRHSPSSDESQFSTCSGEQALSDKRSFSSSSVRPNRDPLSHRIIEKRRRDRMNNCLSNLSKLIPPAYLRKGRGRVEKTEIIEMTIKYIRQLQTEQRSLYSSRTLGVDSGVPSQQLNGTQQSQGSNITSKESLPESRTTATSRDEYRRAVFDCLAEINAFLSVAPVDEVTRTQLLLHLKRHFSNLFDPVDSYERANLKAATQLFVDTSAPASRYAVGPASCEGPLNMSMKKTAEQSCSAAGFENKNNNSLATKPMLTWSRASSNSAGGCLLTPAMANGGVLRMAPAAGREQTAAGFVLHGSGLYYVPFALPVSNRYAVVPTTSDQSNFASQLHPITIAVLFEKLAN